MSILHDYLSRPGFGPAAWENERKTQLRLLAERRGRPNLVYAARLAMPPGLALPIDLNFDAFISRLQG